MNNILFLVRTLAAFIMLIAIFFAICAISKISMMFFNVLFTSKQKNKWSLGLKEGIDLAKPDIKKFVILMLLGLVLYYITVLLI